MKKQKILMILLALAVLGAGAAEAKGARMGGMRISPSIARPAAPKAAPKQATPAQKTAPVQQEAQKQNASQAGEKSGAESSRRNIDEGIDPKDYGKKNAGTGSTAPAGTSSGFFGGSGFFRGFSLWPWMWFGSMNHSAAAEDGNAAASETAEETPSWWESLWASIMNFFGLAS